MYCTVQCVLTVHPRRPQGIDLTRIQFHQKRTQNPRQGLIFRPTNKVYMTQMELNHVLHYSMRTNISSQTQTRDLTDEYLTAKQCLLHTSRFLAHAKSASTRSTYLNLENFPSNDKSPHDSNKFESCIALFNAH